MPNFEGGGKDKDSTAEHVRAFTDYLAIHEVRIVAEGGDEPDWELIYKRFGYSLLGLAKKIGLKIKNWQHKLRPTMKTSSII